MAVEEALRTHPARQPASKRPTSPALGAPSPLAVRRAHDLSRPEIHVRHRRWPDAICMAVLFAVSVAGHLLLSAQMVGPIIQMDEEGYLGEANLFGHGSGYLLQQGPYHPGYGLLLAPVARWARDPQTLYRSALVLNALALGGLVVAAYLLARRLVGRSSPLLCTGVAVLVGLYPSYLGWGDVATEASVFVTICAFVAVGVGWAAAGQRPLRWMVPGVLGGICYCLHPLGLPVTLAVLAVAAANPGRGRERVGSAAAALLGVLPPVGLTIASLNRVLSYSRSELLRPGVVRAGTPAAVLPQLLPKADTLARSYRHLDVAQFQRLLYEAAGQSWYLLVASVGIVGIGLVVAVRSVRRIIAGRSRSAQDVVGLFGIIVFAIGLATSSHHWNLPPGGGGQGDMLIYGRFNEEVLVPVLVLGACEVLRLRRKAPMLAMRWAGGVIAAVAVCGWLLRHGRSAAALAAPIVSYNVLALQPAIHVRGGIDVLWISVAGAAAAVLVVLLAREAGAWLVVPLLGAAWIASGLTGNASLVRDSRARSHQRVVLHALELVDRTVGPPRCVGYDLDTENEWTISTDQVFRPTTVMHRFNSLVGEQPCSDLVLSTRLDLPRDYPGARIMAGENFTGMRLWVLPGPAQAALDKAGLLLPLNFPAPLPDRAFASKLTLLQPPPLQASSGSTFTLLVGVHHVGIAAPWPSRFGLAGFQKGWVSMAVGWSLVDAPAMPLGQSMKDAERHDLSVPLWPGESATEVLKVRAVGPGGVALPPGRYRLTVALVQEGVDFFGDRAPLLNLPLHVDLDVGAPPFGTRFAAGSIRQRLR